MNEIYWPLIWGSTLAAWVVSNIVWQRIAAGWRALSAAQSKETEAWRRMAIDLTRRHEPDAYSALAGICARNGWAIPSHEPVDLRE